MGEHDVTRLGAEDRLQQFMKAVLRDVRALEHMLDAGCFESGVRRIGAEQELFLVDEGGRPAPVAVEVLERLGHPQFTTELARFNLEANLLPQTYGGSCLRMMEQEARDLVARARTAAADVGARVVLSGILPTLRQEDLGLDNMTPNPRYDALNEAMTRMRGGQFDFRIKGVDELEITHDNVMLESCNTSFQIHFQVGCEEFARLYNLAQAITAPVLAAAVNSPLLLGRRLWKETRVALFRQSVDARNAAHQKRGLKPRVRFGDDWIERSVLEIFRDDVARFRAILSGGDLDEDPEAEIADGRAPKMTALRLHNGTVYRWNRPCYGVTGGKAHLRIENRVLPAGPSLRDEMANAAFFFGLMSALAEEYGPIDRLMRFEDAKQNFYAAARHGLRAQFTWLDGRQQTASELILEHLLPLARQGLRFAGIEAADVDTYLGTLEERVRSGTTGARWMLESLSNMHDGTRDERLRALVEASIERQESGEPVHRWRLAERNESGGWTRSFERVGQFMTTDLFTVQPGDVVDLAASLMEWRHIRHVPVEDDDGRLVGLVSHRALLRLVGRDGLRGKTVTVRDIMRQQPVSVMPDTPTLTAIELMRAHKVGCLPVVDAEQRLVGIITERDLIEVAAELFEAHLRATAAGNASPVSLDGGRATAAPRPSHGTAGDGDTAGGTPAEPSV